MINRAEFGGAARIQKTVKPFAVFALLIVAGVLTACVETGSLSELSIFKQQPAYQSDGTYNNRGSQKNAKLLPLKKVKSEALLNAEGQWNVIEQSRTYDYARAHMLAREGVNTKSFKKKKELAAHFEPNAKSGRDGKLRVLRIEGGNLDDRDMFAYDVAADSSVAVVKPARIVSETYTKPEGKGVMGALSSIFSGGDRDASPKTYEEPSNKILSSSASFVVIPARKPNRSIKVARATSHKPLGHKIVKGAVTYPPRLPLRRVSNQKVSIKAPSPVLVEPSSKPTININTKSKANTKSQLQISPSKTVKDSRLVKMRGVMVPVPGTKPRSSAKSVRTFVAPQKQKTKVVQKGVVSDKPISVVKLRAGAHSSKTRLVIEISDTTRYKAAVDGLRNVLQVKIDNAKWGIANQASFGNNALLGTYIARENKDGSATLEVRLKKPSKILESLILRPNKSSAHRIVIDLKN